MNDRIDCPDQRRLLATDRVFAAASATPGQDSPQVETRKLPISTSIIAASVGDGEADFALVEPLEKVIVLMTIQVANDHHHWFDSIDDVVLPNPLTELGCFNLTIVVNGGTSSNILFWIIPPAEK